jgi:hypothetical protein
MSSNRRQAQITAAVQSQQPFLVKQLSLYFEIASVIGKLTVFTPDDKEWGEAEPRFWELYWSELPVVADKNVEDAMVTLASRLHDYTSARREAKKQQKPFNDLQKKCDVDRASLEVAHAVRASIEAGWKTLRVQAPEPYLPKHNTEAPAKPWCTTE